MNLVSLIKSIWFSFRPKTLTAAIVPCIAATALALGCGFRADFEIFGFALLSSISIQIGTNLINDALDFKKGADTEMRLGPLRITQSGILSFHQVMFLALAFFIIALFLGIPIVLKGGVPLFVIGLLSVAMGYAYTGGPFPLAYLGLGEIFVILFFGLISVSALYFLHTGNLSLDPFVLGLQIGLHASVLIAVNNLRDRETDLLANKKTLAVRFGVPFAKIEIYFFCLAPFILNFFWWQRGFLKAMFLPLLCLPVAILLSKKIFQTPPGPSYNAYLGLGALLHLVFGLLISVGFLLQ